MSDLSVAEGRLIAVYRAIEKFNRPELINTMDASVINSYITNVIDLDTLMDLATEDQVEYYLDGLILGLVISRLLNADVAPDDLPIPQDQRKRQFQTGVDVESGAVRVNTT